MILEFNGDWKTECDRLHL